MVGEALPQAQPEAGKGNRPWVSGEADACAAASVLLAVDPEAVQVDVLLTHRDLDDVMEVGNRRVALHEDATPDQWRHVAQDQPELVDARGGLAHGSAFYATLPLPQSHPLDCDGLYGDDADVALLEQQRDAANMAIEGFLRARAREHRRRCRSCGRMLPRFSSYSLCQACYASGRRA